MTDLAHKHKSQLERIKNNVENAYDSFKENYDRYNEFRRFVYIETMSDNEKTLLSQLKKPQVEFNILEAYVSRLRGEFSKQEPSIIVSAKPGKEVDGELIELIDGHLRYILQEANKSGLEYNVYTDTLSGGFSAIKVYSDYTGEMSFHQDIYIRRAFDPTMVCFDPMAMMHDKSDAEYCFEIFPKRKEDLEREFPNIDFSGLKSMSASPSIGKFQWSYNLNDDEVILVADYYEKKRTKKSIVMLAPSSDNPDNQVMTTAEYNQLLEDWMASGRIDQPPSVIGKPRTTELIEIVRYKMVGNEIIDYEDTPYKKLPLIFVDGNSILGKKGGTGVVRQFTRPYVYNAKGAQKMKNFALQTLCNEIENMGPSKLIVAKDAIPPQYLDAYTNPQQAIVYIYNAFKNDNADIPLPPPQPMPRPVIPQEIAAASMMSDQLVSNILGSFDTSMSQMTQEQMSGKAVQEVSTLSNAAAMPYVVSFMRGLQSAAQSVVDLIPLYYTTKRTIPIIDKNGKKSDAKINQEGGISMDYEHDAIQVNVEAGVSFNLQQDKALQHINALMHASPKIAKFFSGDGMKYLFNNMSFRGVEHIEQDIEKFIAQENEIEKQMMQAQMQKPKIEEQAMQVAAQQVQSESQIGMAKVQQQAAAESIKAELKSEEIALEREKLRVEIVRMLSDMRIEEERLGIEQQRASDERINTMIDAAVKQSEHIHGVTGKQFERALGALESDRTHDREEKSTKKQDKE